MRLSEVDRKVFSVLSGDGGFTTADVADRANVMAGCTRRQQSAATLQSLLRLETLGLVKRMDGERPIVWVLAQMEGGES